MSAPASAPYRRFLATADTAAWRSCLDEALDGVRTGAGATPAARASALTEALCIAGYLIWLSRRSGEWATEDAARAHYVALSAELARRSPGAPPGTLDVAWGVALGLGGYQTRAAPLLQRDGVTAPEHLLLVVPDAPVRQVAALGPLFAGPSPCAFVPAAHVLGTALISLGAMHEARALVVRVAPDAPPPLLLDVLGTVEERLGRFADADLVYRRSPWPSHRYRARMSAATAGRRVDANDLEPDAAVLRQLGELGGGDLDQAEIARSAAFLGASLWQPDRGWVVETELGKLSFRRRRYAEADLHFRRALRSAPRPAQPVLHRLRFYAFTWLTDDSPHVVLTMEPEALTAGRAALEVGVDDDDLRAVLVWIASNTSDPGMVPAELGAWDPFLRAEALNCVGEQARAVDAWIEALRTGYQPRAVHGLIRQLRQAGCTRGAAHLADVVLRESWHDFRSLLETARVLDDPGTAPESAGFGDTRAQQTEAFRRRLVELSEQEFKNAIQCYALMRLSDQLDLAEELLQRLAKQADGVSELLAVAVLRRGSTMTMHARDEGLRCLHRARAQARDRSERLQIARELFHYGQTREARAVLAEEDAFGDARPLSHADAVVLVQCAGWLSGEEVAGIVDRAAGRLLADHAAGRLAPHVGRYRRRLVRALERVTPSVGEALVERLAARLEPLDDVAPAGPWPGATDAGWPAVRRRLGADVDEHALDAPIGLTEVSGADSSFGQRLAALGELRAAFTRWTGVAQRVSVPVEPDTSPVTDGDDRGDGPRTIQLRELWRARLAPLGRRPLEARARDVADLALRAFFEEDRVFGAYRDQRRREETAPNLRRAARVGEALAGLLPALLGPAEHDDPHPAFRSLFAAVAEDVTALLRESDEQLTALRAELPGPDEEGTHGVVDD